MSLFTDTVTVYRRSGDTWARAAVLRGVQLRQRLERVNENGKSTYQTVTSLTIPAGIEHAVTADGDTALIRGEGPEVSADMTIRRIRAENTSFCIVNAVTDNTHRDHLPHWKVIAT